MYATPTGIGGNFKKFPRKQKITYVRKHETERSNTRKQKNQKTEIPFILGHQAFVAPPLLSKPRELKVDVPGGHEVKKA